MSRLFINAIISSLAYTFIPGFTLAQEVPSLPEPTKFIDRIEIFAGSGLNIPNDKGWYKRISKDSQSLISGEFSSRIGYSLGVGITHSLSNRFKINAYMLWDTRGYRQDNTTIGDNNNIFGYKANARTDYITVQLAPNFFISRNYRLFVSSGVFYSHLLSSFIKEKSYLNGLHVQSSSIRNSSEVSNYEFGFIVAFGYEFTKIKSLNLFLRLQGNFGLTDIVKANELMINNNGFNLLVILKRRNVN